MKINVLVDACIYIAEERPPWFGNGFRGHG